MTDQTATGTGTGTDDELHQILHGEYACTRTWDAWQYGTMTEADFTPMGETEIADDLLAWRDAAVAAKAAEAEKWRTAFEDLHARLLRDLPGDASELPPPEDEYWAQRLDDLLMFSAELHGRANPGR